MSENFNPNLPAFLQRTPQQIADDEARQREMRQASNARVHQNAEERAYTQAIDAEKLVRENMAVAESEMMPFYQSKLAESLSQQGRFQEAAEIEPDVEKKEWYLKVWDAIERDDSESCDCSPESQRNPATGEKVTLPTTFTRANVYSTKHKRMVQLVECSCGDLNAR